jgi:hypothetical protein
MSPRAVQRAVEIAVLRVEDERPQETVDHGRDAPRHQQQDARDAREPHAVVVHDQRHRERDDDLERHRYADEHHGVAQREPEDLVAEQPRVVGETGERQLAGAQLAQAHVVDRQPAGVEHRPGEDQQ